MSISDPTHVCCCHSDSPKDIRLFENLRKHLATLINSQRITLWHPGEIRPGDNREVETVFHLATADIILLLQSPDFLSSHFCLKQEAFALTLYHQRQTSVIPILLTTSDWEHSPVFQLEPLPHNRKAVASYSGDKRDQVFLDIVLCIRAEVDRLYKHPRRRDVFAKEDRRLVMFPPGVRELSVNDLQRIGRFLPEAGLTIPGKYRIAGVASDQDDSILRHLPLGIPGYTPFSISIDTSDCMPRNITKLRVLNLTGGGFEIHCNIIDVHLPYEVAGNVTICY